MTALVYCPYPDRDSAVTSAGIVIEEGLVACVNILGVVHSLFVWNGEAGEADEVGVLFKTDATLLDRAVARIEQLHPYDTPAILGWPCPAASDATRAWLGALEAIGQP